MSTESNHSSIENLNTIRLDDGSIINYNLLEAPEYIWRVDSQGDQVNSDYHYAWGTPQEASYRALINGNVNLGNQSLLQGVARRENGLITIREVDTSRAFSSSFGQYKLRQDKNLKILNLTFTEGFIWMDLKDQVERRVREFRQHDVNVIGFTKVHDNGDDSMEFFVDFEMYERMQTVEIQLNIVN